MEATICVIDDDEIFHFTSRVIIQRSEFGLNDLHFDSGADALTFFNGQIEAQTLFPECILLDINMPDMTGWEFLNEFEPLYNQIANKPAIFILSSSINPVDLEKSKAHPLVKGFITKPINQKQLDSLVENNFESLSF